ncbi:MAG: trimethylamine methyltransferase family protein [Desulfobacula sp.]|uniref:trimethylamine methyltransferase family protein n=1 Tax=Desulfobacula sp. TaxID=2593537 RepID=UPI0025BAB22A|nr:trimethylamine methyltransferase family protein [Desulfobacula sp.]MCD4719532.1 trimethylamine methyltransferase family protein [Desulfobacula sp.]
MNLMGLQGGQYRPLSPEQIKTVHEASMKILEKTGITYEQGLEDTVQMLEDNGAAIDRDRKKISFSNDMITEQVAKAPEKVVLCGQDPKNDLHLTENRVHLGTGGAAIKILDMETGRVRSTTLKDLYDVSRLVDQLDNIHFLVRPCIATDIDKADYDINMFYACLAASSKHVMAGVNDEQGLHNVIEMASMIAKGLDKLTERPFISVITSFAISPLKLCTQSTHIMQEANRNRIPVALSSAPMAGSTSPLTMAGTLAQLHAEQLAGITICQLTNPGAPLLYGGIPGMANLKTMGYSGGAVECGMMNAAIHQLSNHIKVPNYNSAGLSDSKVPDAQAGYEKAFTALLASMGGANYIHHSAGMLESMLTIAHEQFVIDDEIIGNCCKVLKGIDVDAEHLALEVIESVGPGGNFMTSPHTMTHLRTEYYNGNGVTDRKSREKWEQDGSLDTRQRALGIARKFLAGSKPSYIPEEIDKAIKEKFNILL